MFREGVSARNRSTEDGSGVFSLGGRSALSMIFCSIGDNGLGGRRSSSSSVISNDPGGSTSESENSSPLRCSSTSSVCSESASPNRSHSDNDSLSFDNSSGGAGGIGVYNSRCLSASPFPISVSSPCGSSSSDAGVVTKGRPLSSTES